MNREKLEALLANGSITQEEYNEAMEKFGLTDPNPPVDPPVETNPPEDDLDERLEKLVQAKVDKITSKLGKEKAELQKKYDRLKEEKLTGDEKKQLELDEKERDMAERERALHEQENRLYAIKSIKAAGLDDGSDKSLELVEFVLCDEQEDIDKRVKAFGDLVKKFAKSEIDKTFKDNGRNPNGGGKSSSVNNPYAKESFNLTEQMRLEATDPELASKMKSAAGIK